jgi:hypothetical protein
MTDTVTERLTIEIPADTYDALQELLDRLGDGDRGRLDLPWLAGSFSRTWLWCRRGRGAGRRSARGSGLRGMGTHPAGRENERRLQGRDAGCVHAALRQL